MPASTPPSCDTPNGRLRSTGSTPAPCSSRSEPAAWSADRKTSSSTSPSSYLPPVSRIPGQLPPDLPRTRAHGPSLLTIAPGTDIPVPRCVPVDQVIAVTATLARGVHHGTGISHRLPKPCVRSLDSL